MIPVNEPLLEAEEKSLVQDCLESGWVSSAGRYIEEFEALWSARCGMPHGVAVTNGTAALDVAVACLGLEPGDEVILPSFTIIACASAIIYHGGLPVLVDCDPDTWCMDARQVEAAITPRTRAIMPVHIYGHPVDMDPLLELRDRYGLSIVEDAAEAHGAEYLSGRDSAEPRWLPCGGMGELSVFSFYANKLITTGEGGMVLTNSDAYAEKARGYRNLCFRPEQRFYHTELGHNYRMTNVQAALGVGQLKRFNRIVARKRWIGQTYTERLSDITGIQLPTERPWARNVYWMYGLVVDEERGIDARELTCRLRAEGVETRPFFLGMHEQPALRDRGLFLHDRHPVAERLARRGLYLPSGLALTEEQIDRVCGAVRRVLR